MMGWDLKPPGIPGQQYLDRTGRVQSERPVFEAARPPLLYAKLDSILSNA